MLLSEMKDLLVSLEEEILDGVDEDVCDCYAAGVCDGISTFVDVLSDVLEELAEI